jgi:pimeloyl-ACP methyl ester carboxylesterase
VIGEGIPIIMLHGYACDMRIMKGAYEPIFEDIKGFKRIYFDLPGMGGTKGTEGINCADDMLDLTLKVMDELNVKKFIVTGLSYGGYLARGLMKARPDDVLGGSLIVPVIKPLRKDRKLPESEIFEVDEAFLKTLDDKEFSGVILNEYVYNRVENEIMVAVRNANEEFVQHFQETGYAFTYDVDDTFYDLPFIMFLGKQDDVVGYEDAFSIVENYNQCGLYLLNKAGHSLQIEQVNLFNELTKKWLKEFM